MKTSDSLDFLMILGKILFGDETVIGLQNKGYVFETIPQTRESPTHDIANLKVTSPTGKQFACTFLVREIESK